MLSYLSQMVWHRADDEYLKSTKNRLRGLLSSIQRERLLSWKSSLWRQLRLRQLGPQNCADRGRTKTHRRGQRDGGRVGQAAHAWETILVILHTDGRTVRSHLGSLWTIDELFDWVFLVHITVWPLSRDHWISGTITQKFLWFCDETPTNLSDFRWIFHYKPQKTDWFHFSIKTATTRISYDSETWWMNIKIGSKQSYKANVRSHVFLQLVDFL